jgi:CTP-dependent riboflavin kinase
MQVFFTGLFEKSTSQVHRKSRLIHRIREERYIHKNKYQDAKPIKIYFNRKRFNNKIFTEEKKEFNICYFISSEIKIQYLNIP